MSSCGRRNGNRQSSANGCKPRVNRYNPNQPDWRSVHQPWVKTLARILTPGK